MDIIDLSANTPGSVFTSRGFPISELILHDTAGPNDDNNASAEVCQAAVNATIHWFQGSGGVSIHYLIGPEKLGGKIYRLCREVYAAYHAVGDKGSIDGVSVDNRISIGIERFGQPNEPVGPNQRAAMLWLVEDICQRNGLSSSEVISHMSIQADRRDGNVLLAAARSEVQSGGFQVTSINQPAKPFDPNPLHKDVGPGVIEVLTEEGMTAITNEDYYVPDGNKPGLTKRSFTYADKTGVTFRVEAIQDQDANGKLLDSWTRQIWQFVKEIK